MTEFNKHGNMLVDRFASSFQKLALDKEFDECILVGRLITVTF